MESFSFIREYIRKPRTVGAILPSSTRLANKMVQDVNFKDARCIVEYGPGTGVFTDKLLENRNKNTKVILIEYNEDFCNLLRSKYGNEEKLFIINDSAENIEKYLKMYDVQEVDYIISGLPFASLPKETSINILNTTRHILNHNGSFITFQYTLFKKKFIGSFFHDIKVKRVIKNIPPAYVFSCSNK
ncbi:class I SAM-dependent methyltransferase [Clostridium sp. DJ247]|uniref:class I SAM-dependent methyltransferase n=1 Tax=Clostridium sp. DJ247 TaxID=2726188 RepID=UPI001628777F|nr:rRNA adenine N-6-methyltransferase family protein [Clostridium sp. DJ247]MBC2579569.1 SAM-dependent methyltransferase [Clostridium sp. DJ247]